MRPRTLRYFEHSLPVKSNMFKVKRSKVGVTVKGNGHTVTSGISSKNAMAWASQLKRGMTGMASGDLKFQCITIATFSSYQL